MEIIDLFLSVYFLGCIRIGGVSKELVDMWNWFFKNVKMFEVDIC